MKNIKQEVATWIQLLAFIAIWITLILLSTRELSISWESVKLLPEVVTIYTALYIIFTKWGWRFPFLQGWLIPFPNLDGTWQGTLQTTWQNPGTGVTPEP